MQRQWRDAKSFMTTFIKNPDAFRCICASDFSMFTNPEDKHDCFNFL